MIKARISVTLKPSVLDPQGAAIEKILADVGFDNINYIRQGKMFDIELQENDRAKAEQQLSSMCEKLLANMVIEDYSIHII